MPYKDPELQREYQRKWMSRRRSRYFEGKSCVVCGATEDLELDHIDPAQKVSHRIWSWRWDRVLEETEKCQVLCREHHLEKTLSVYGERVCGTLRSYRYGCRCQECRGANALRARRERQRARSNN